MNYEEKKEVALKLSSQGMRPLTIRKKLGLTRGQVAGIIYRSKRSAIKVPKKPKAAPKKKPKIPTPKINKVVKKVFIKPPKKELTMIRMIDVKENQCSNVIGDPQDYRADPKGPICCGEKVYKESSCKKCYEKNHVYTLNKAERLARYIPKYLRLLKASHYKEASDLTDTVQVGHGADNNQIKSPQ